MEKIIQVWDKTVKYINDPATHADAVKIMANRSGVDPKQYELMVSGTHLLDINANKKYLLNLKDLTQFMALAITSINLTSKTVFIKLNKM